MVQNPKGGGLSSTLGGSSQIGGVQKTTDFLDKSTWLLAGILIALVLLSSLSFTGSLSDNKKIIDPAQSSGPKADDKAKPAATPAKPAATKPAAAPAAPEKK